MEIIGKPFPKLLQRLIAEKEISNDELHFYCLYALRQCLEHGNTGFAIRLLEMLGNRHVTKKRIASWFCTFGNFRIGKEGWLEYRKRRSFTEKGLGDAMAKANATPFYAIVVESINIPKLTTTTVQSRREKKNEKAVPSTSVWTVSGGLPSLGKRR